MKRLVLSAIALAALDGRPVYSDRRGEIDERDVVTLTDGKALRVRVHSRYGAEGVVLFRGSQREEIPAERVAGIQTVRDNLRTFLNERRSGLEFDEEWQLVERAKNLGLPAMARVQAYHLLVQDPGFEPAHEALGHRRRGKEWKWKLGDNKWFRRKDFEKRMSDWDRRFVLQSENWILETNTSVKNAVDLLMDLERLYVLWMDAFAEELEANEFVRDREKKMVCWVLRDPTEPGINWLIPEEHAPYYSASPATATQEGNPNVSITYQGSGTHPERFFDIATQQLMYSMLVVENVKGGIPPDDITRHSHWVELGMGYWFSRQISGLPGYVKREGLAAGAEISRLAKTIPDDGPLTKAGDEVTNLIGLPMQQFYLSNDRDDVHRAKACSFFEFLIEEDPPVMHGKKQLGSGRAGLICYLKSVYRAVKAHSSSAFDKCLGGKVQLLEKPWKEWMP